MAESVKTAAFGVNAESAGFSLPFMAGATNG
jgi:hypothetical protein